MDRPHLRTALLDKFSRQVAAAARITQKQLVKNFGPGSYEAIFGLSDLLLQTLDKELQYLTKVQQHAHVLIPEPDLQHDGPHRQPSACGGDDESMDSIVSLQDQAPVDDRASDASQSPLVCNDADGNPAEGFSQPQVTEQQLHVLIEDRLTCIRPELEAQMRNKLGLHSEDTRTLPVFRRFRRLRRNVAAHPRGQTAAHPVSGLNVKELKLAQKQKTAEDTAFNRRFEEAQCALTPSSSGGLLTHAHDLNALAALVLDALSDKLDRLLHPHYATFSYDVGASTQGFAPGNWTQLNEHAAPFVPRGLDAHTSMETAHGSEWTPEKPLTDSNACLADDAVSTSFFCTDALAKIREAEFFRVSDCVDVAAQTELVVPLVDKAVQTASEDAHLHTETATLACAADEAHAACFVDQACQTLALDTDTIIPIAPVSLATQVSPTTCGKGVGAEALGPEEGEVRSACATACDKGDLKDFVKWAASKQAVLCLPDMINTANAFAALAEEPVAEHVHDSSARATACERSVMGDAKGSSKHLWVDFALDEACSLDGDSTTSTFGDAPRNTDCSSPDGCPGSCEMASEWKQIARRGIIADPISALSNLPTIDSFKQWMPLNDASLRIQALQSLVHMRGQTKESAAMISIITRTTIVLLLPSAEVIPDKLITELTKSILTLAAEMPECKEHLFRSANLLRLALPGHPALASELFGSLVPPRKARRKITNR
eukprot:TRINITY_DN19484_c0_g1_i1.p1 TRINITY_DN19484_c0_g1~~TRINITY_DN19484_c0_g1_i1.p1  ORF type:complete len:718 (-),score=124.36 TRINITY_DN19484_c0_g1_i1:332-2485(-)